MTKKEEYFELVGSTAQAVEFENYVLQTGGKFLPFDILDQIQNKADQPPVDSYWQFMINQWNKSEPGDN